MATGKMAKWFDASKSSMSFVGCCNMEHTLVRRNGFGVSMAGDTIDIALLVDELRARDTETEWIEFKVNNSDPSSIGERISALANSACRHGVPTAYMVWGIDDDTHDVVGSKFYYRSQRVGQEELENWLHHQLSENAAFTFGETDIGDKHVTVLAISAAYYHTVDFEKVAYIRIGSYTKKLKDYPAVESEVWDRITKSDFESVTAKGGLGASEALDLIDYPSYFSLLGMPMPQSAAEVTRYLCEDEILCRQDDGRYAITNLGAILLARRMRDFPSVSRKTLRIVQYEGTGRTDVLRSKEYSGGYANEFGSAVDMIMALTPAREDISGAFRRSVTAYPERAVREILANALIHQDLGLSGNGPVVEIFSNRIDFTNPGKSLVDLMRLVDNPPKSRNQRLASLMRRFRICEELGTGWDKIIQSCEMAFMPAPKVTEYDDAGGSMRVSLLSYVPFSSMGQLERIMTCYWHACICFASDVPMRNQSLRARFGDEAPSASSISKLIAATVDAGLIKLFDESAAPRFRCYVPFWA